MIKPVGKITEDIRRYIASEFLLDDRSDDLKVTDLLFEGGIIDSAGAITLIMHLEQCYDVEIKDEELFPDNFATIEHIVRFIERKKTGQVDLMKMDRGV
jgi:acyl carrier protein